MSTLTLFSYLFFSKNKKQHKMTSNNIESQKDEIEALSSIYGKDFSLLGANTFDLRICCDDIKWWAVTVSVLLPEGYPSADSPLYEIHTECLAGKSLVF